jgi:ABC-2 type transport system permease protein
MSGASRLFSWRRLGAIARKELIQLRRDRLTFAMMVGIPILQLILFGFAINADPKHLPTAIVAPEPSPFTRSLIAALRNTDYFDIVAVPDNSAAADRMIEDGDVLFVLQIPTDFGRRLVRGERPPVLLEADATDPAATSNALAALQQIGAAALARDLNGPLASLKATAAPFDVRLQRRYNPEGVTQYNIVPGLIGTILTMTMIIMTALSITRELERGTMEPLLAMPVRPLEVMIGKILPYIFVGFLQIAVILLTGVGLFGVPFEGSVLLLLCCALPFISANLTVGLMFSSVARNQMQAMQMGFFFFLPSILLSGFMFPFRGMPQWAQTVGNLLPLTHFLRIVRGILLKGNGVADVLPHVWPLLAFTVAVLAIGVGRFRRTLD